MKKKAALLLVLALLLNVMMPMSSFAENTVVLSDSLSSDTMTIGKEETITYELSLPAESNINNLQLEIHYDVVKNDDLLNSLDNYIKTNHIGIIALTSYKRNIFSRLFNPGIARKMIFHSDTPLLVICGRSN